MLSSAILHEKNGIMALIFSFYFSVVIAYSLMDNAMTIFHLFNLQNKGYQKNESGCYCLGYYCIEEIKTRATFLSFELKEVYKAKRKSICFSKFTIGSLLFIPSHKSG